MVHPPYRGLLCVKGYIDLNKDSGKRVIVNHSWTVGLVNGDEQEKVKVTGSVGRESRASSAPLTTL